MRSSCRPGKCEPWRELRTRKRFSRHASRLHQKTAPPIKATSEVFSTSRTHSLLVGESLRVRRYNFISSETLTVRSQRRLSVCSWLRFSAATLFCLRRSSPLTCRPGFLVCQLPDQAEVFSRPSFEERRPCRGSAPIDNLGHVLWDRVTRGGLSRLFRLHGGRRPRSSWPRNLVHPVLKQRPRRAQGRVRHRTSQVVYYEPGDYDQCSGRDPACERRRKEGKSLFWDAQKGGSRRLANGKLHFPPTPITRTFSLLS